jgi:peptidoglycan/xylan/chitin deacetylase (PgdA/CDA1 family)
VKTPRLFSAIRKFIPVLLCVVSLTEFSRAGEPRPLLGEIDQRFWLENMLVHHGYSPEEVKEATGMSAEEIDAARKRWQFPSAPPPRTAAAFLKVLPYPGGRHPRLGFFDGAVDPQRETKLSVFTPWDQRSYAVVDVPEAIWSNLGLTYLAHTHIDTIWSKRGIAMERLEWSRRADGALTSERRLPNGITFGVRAVPQPRHVEFRLWLRNGSAQPLTNLRSQVCVMLGRAAGFTAQSETNKLLESPFSAARDETGRRWIITAWDGLDRVWQNPPVPCIHSDPKLPDCPPGETRAARGWLWFYEGDDIRGELTRLRRTFLDVPAIPVKTKLEPVPDKLVVLTFDDSVSSHYHAVRPLLKELGFNATFFITEGFNFRTNKSDYMTWEQIAELHRDGFEIGNHTMSHMGINAGSVSRLREEVEFIAKKCEEHHVPRPVSFAYPGNAIHPAALPVLKEAGIQWARRGAQPEYAYETGRGIACEPREDHPLLLPTTGDARPAWTMDDLQRAAGMAKDGHIAILQFHGVPDREHPWVNTPPEKFTEYMRWLKTNGFRCIALRDLSRHIDPADAPAEPWSIIERRQAIIAGKAR